MKRVQMNKHSLLLRNKSRGIISILVLIIIIAVAGTGAYIYSKKFVNVSNPSPTPITSAITQEIVSQSSSDKISEIETDIDNTNFSSIDSDLNNLGKELDSALSQ